MADVFISYANQDRDRARTLANALQALGWSVWWDRKIIAGDSFDQTIERELEIAGSVIVLWSTHSIGSEWVKTEAAVAAERGVLVPALVDSVKVPLEFRRRQAADLVGWEGGSSHEGFRTLCTGVGRHVKSRVTTTLIAPMSSTPHVTPTTAFAADKRSSRRWYFGAIGAATILLALGGYWGVSTFGGEPKETPPTDAQKGLVRPLDTSEPSPAVKPDPAAPVKEACVEVSESQMVNGIVTWTKKCI